MAMVWEAKLIQAVSLRRPSDWPDPLVEIMLPSSENCLTMKTVTNDDHSCRQEPSQRHNLPQFSCHVLERQLCLYILVIQSDKKMFERKSYSRE